MLRVMKMLLAAAVVAGGLTGVSAATAEAGDFCHGYGCVEFAPVYVAPVCYYKVFYYDHCGLYRCYGTYHNLYTAKHFAHHLDCLGYATIVKTIH